MAREAPTAGNGFFYGSMMVDHQNEVRAVIADLESYLAKIDDYAIKPLSDLDCEIIHQYNVKEEEYIRLDTLMERLCPSEREGLENCFMAISRCSHPFSSLHVAANDHRPVDQQELTQLVEWLRQEINKSIRFLAGAINEDSPQEKSGYDDFWHSEDFTTVRYRGDEYVFNKTQALCVKYLFENTTASEKTVGCYIDSQSDTYRLCHTFREKKTKSYHPSWGKLIVPASAKGVFKLAISKKTAK